MAKDIPTIDELDIDDPRYLIEPILGIPEEYQKPVQEAIRLYQQGIEYPEFKRYVENKFRVFEKDREDTSEEDKNLIFLLKKVGHKIIVKEGLLCMV